jgi:glycerophosphoryl diester phosphodiesterase
VQVLKEMVSTVITWPVNSLETFEAVRTMGVDGITSDSLELIRAVAGRRVEAADAKSAR